MQSPTAAELLNDATVLQALEDAWALSLPESPIYRHEEGGWIYMDTTTGAITVRRAPSGAQAVIDLNNPPLVPGSMIVGKFHTHPEPDGGGLGSGSQCI